VRRPISPARCAVLAAATLLAACVGAEDGRSPAPREPVSILLVTLDTTRADAVTPEVTPRLARLAASGARFSHAYATAPMTLPAHASLLTGRYPAEHGVHENGRAVSAAQPLLAEALRGAGYTTAAFVSAWVLDRQFGLARGFDVYDDALDGAGAGGSLAQERAADLTTDRALAWLATAPRDRPLFLWVHYFDAHAPYDPPEPFRSRFAGDPYRGEVAFADAQLGRLVDAFAAAAGDRGHRVAVAGDHGEGLGEHGEAQHGRLLYQGVMRVPLVLAGAGMAPAEVTEPVSARRVHDTVLAWAGLEAAGSLLDAPRAGDAVGAADPEVVLGEAMLPYLAYGWQPQVMALRGGSKAIRAGRVELYDVVADPAESRDLAGTVRLDRALAAALGDYPLPRATGDSGVDEETRRRLAALGYATTSAGSRAPRADAPRPADMAHLFADLDAASGAFTAGRYAEAVEPLARVAAEDPGNLMVAVQIAASHSLLGDAAEAERWFARARAIDPASPELQHYHGLHLCGRAEWAAAEPLLAASAAREPRRVPTLECLARAHEALGRPAAAAAALERLAELRREPLRDLLRAGELRMAAGDTGAAIADFERARTLAGDAFDRHLELGVLYLAARRFAEARDALDRVPPAHPERPMALFKRAQVSVLLAEPDARERVRRATAEADDTTRELIARERLFATLR
jgi:arylsulfatase A-like enzyme/Tfp pilus assembly protein PilF